MPHIVGMILICIIMTVFFVDCGITVATILKFNKRLKIMDEMAERIHKLSDEIGENIYENVTDIMEKSGEFQETHAELLDKLAETTGAAKDKIAETTGTAKNKITGTTETAREKIAETTGNAKEKITDTAANAKLAISENIMEAKSSFEAKKNAWTEKSEEWKKNREKQKAELSELSEKYEHLFEEKNFGFQRLMKAFPDMKSRENDKTLTEFKKHFRLDKPEQNKNRCAAGSSGRRNGENMIRTVDTKIITENVKEMCIEANHYLSKDMDIAMKNAVTTEKSELGRKILNQLQDNLKIADEEMIPICQDTGMAVIFLEVGQDVHFEGEAIEDAINEGVRQGYTEGYLRKSVVKDPLIRENTRTIPRRLSIIPSFRGIK